MRGMGASRIKIEPELGDDITWDVDDVYFKEIAGNDGQRHIFLHFIAKHPSTEDPDDGRD